VLPAASATLNDIRTVFDFLLKEHGKEPKDVVLYGQSVGSGPTCHLAAAHPGVAGVVLHSAFLSGE
jgi:dienelactone hydrolase